jgi:hypothetical protein
MTSMRTKTDCPTCGAAVDERSRFCAQCGTRLPGTDGTAVIETPPHETSRAPVAVMRNDARFYGVTPPITVLVLAFAALAVAILLLAQGNTVLGVGVLVVAVALFGGFLVLAKREAVAHARERAGSVIESLAVRGRARQELLRLRQELHVLGERRERGFATLGRAVYEENDDQVRAAQDELRRCHDEIAAKEAQMQTIVAEADAQIQRSRLQTDTTNVIQPPQPGGPIDPGGPIPVPEPYPPPDEADPPQPEPVPEPYPPDEIDPPRPA